MAVRTGDPTVEQTDEKTVGMLEWRWAAMLAGMMVELMAEP